MAVPEYTLTNIATAVVLISVVSVEFTSLNLPVYSWEYYIAAILVFDLARHIYYYNKFRTWNSIGELFNK